MTQMDSLLSQGMGTVKGMKARLEGLVGVFRTLTEQHGEVTALLKRVRGNPEKRRELWPQIRMELISHERGEVHEVYPVLRNHPDTRDLADLHDDEARELEQMIEKLDTAPIDSDAWGALFDQLTNTVIEHATEEERDIFPAAQQALGEQRAEQLDAKFLLAKQQIAAAL